MIPKKHRFAKTVEVTQDYAEAKRQAESAFFTDAKFRVIAARFPIVCGPDDYTSRLEFHVVGAMNGATIIKSEPMYVYAQYRTPLMKFIDDVEFVLDAPNQVIHMRSASRIGRSDLGANRKRLELIRSRFNS